MISDRRGHGLRWAVRGGYLTIGLLLGVVMTFPWYVIPALCTGYLGEMVADYVDEVGG